jgi:hypothetical protein
VLDSLTGGRVPHWAAGVAIPSLERIVIPAYRPTGSRLDDPVVVLRHELAHLALNAYLPRPIPRWFDEGYATWVSGGLDESAGWQIRFAFLLGRGPPLDSLTLDWPRAEGRARLAYLLSASAVRHLATRSGEPAFHALLVAWREQGTLEAALRSVYQMTGGQFEREWREMVKRRYGWLLAASQIGAFWVGLTILLLVLGSFRRRRTRAKLERMREQERWEPVPEHPPWLATEEELAEQEARDALEQALGSSEAQAEHDEGGSGVDRSPHHP